LNDKAESVCVAITARGRIKFLRDVVELNVWQKKELMPRETQLQLYQS